jgi:hypothetical protein
VGVIGICFGISVLKIGLDTIIDVNGSVIGFFFIYLIPVAIHFRCKYMKQDKLL